MNDPYTYLFLKYFLYFLIFRIKVFVLNKNELHIDNFFHQTSMNRILFQKSRSTLCIYCWNVFLIPIVVPDEVGTKLETIKEKRKAESRFIDRIEDGIVIDLHLNSKLVKAFYDNWDFYSHSYRDDKKIDVEFEGSKQIIGLSKSITC